MTPTPEQLAAVLPRVAAGIDGGDWTDDAERLAWATRVLRYVEEAMPEPDNDLRFGMTRAICEAAGFETSKVTSVTYEHDASGWPSMTLTFLNQNRHPLELTTQRWVPAESPDSAPESPESDENAVPVPQDPGNGTGESSGRSLPPPVKGTHESDLGSPHYGVAANGGRPCVIGDRCVHEFRAAARWSRNRPPAPGITYHDAEEAM